MANNQKGGFFPVGVRGGGSVEHARKRVLTNNTNAIFKGDAVVPVNDGGWVVATATNTAIGSVSMGCSYVDSTGVRVPRHYLPAATTYSGSTVDPEAASYLYVVADAVNVEFEASADEALTLTNLLNNFELVLTVGSTVTGYSKHEIDTSTAATTSTLPIRVTDFIFDGQNDVDSADVRVRCRINAGFVEPALTTTGT